MDIIITLIIMFTMQSGDLNGETVIRIQGFDSVESCELAGEELRGTLPVGVSDVTIGCTTEENA